MSRTARAGVIIPKDFIVKFTSKTDFAKQAKYLIEPISKG
jgi:hypothetical protein